MNKIKKLFYYLSHNPKVILFYLWDNVAPLIHSDKLFLAIKFRLKMGYWMNFDKPQTFCEKLQWLKLYNREPEYTQMVDKIGVKKYVAERIGEQYIIPTIGMWNKAEDIPWNELPNQFVVKVTHDSGGLVICKDKTNLDIPKAIRILNNGLKKDYFAQSREWPYKNVMRRIIVERYMADERGKDLIDYKWFCFNGKPVYCQVIQDRSTKETIDFFDTQWNHQDFIGLNPNVSAATTQPSKPSNIEEQIYIAKKLSRGIPFIRVDLYNIKDKVYFGELTFYPASGMGKFRPQQYDFILGNLIMLPTK